ncbi:MAG: DUF87 domain-containing protein [Gemmataceae bacterium]
MPGPLPDYEKLGVFYLGRDYDLDARTTSDRLVLLDSKDLVTHAVIVGMTGSGKTGLGIALLEEAAIDGVPALIIDPKGDLANLLLTFPELRPADFAPWVNAEEARRKGKTVDEYAADQAQLWKKGLADWREDGERVARLRAAADIALYTPGSSAGTPVSIVQSFAAPAAAAREDSEAFNERVNNAAGSLLALLGVDGDPLQSREHILLANILAQAWKDGTNLDLPALIQRLHTPPFERVGVMDLESFFPAKERFAFAMRLNNLLASPGFETWLQGAPLDIAALLFTPQGKPRLSILSIAHLGDKERMFFVTLLLNQVLSWMRAQPGTTSLRALLYMDEIFGYFPPVANPPSKRPLLTMLKQARAFGLGIVLATQNPVDLDYKGLANTGAWFIGRLQTERDKARVLDGLEGAASAAGSAFDRASMDRLLSGLGNRIFLLNNVHEDGPCVFQVRWAMSYLCGPLTKAQLKQLAPQNAPEGAPAEAAATPARPVFEADARPVLPPAVPQFFLPATLPPPMNGRLVYAARILGLATVYFRDTRKEVDHDDPVAFLADPAEGQTGLSWSDAACVSVNEKTLERDPVATAGFAQLPAPAAAPKNYEAWKKALVDYLARERELAIFECDELEATSHPGETEAAFRARLALLAREKRDLEAEKLRQKFAPKLAALQERVRKAEVTVEKEKSQSTQSKLSTVLSFGSTVLHALLGRKTLSVTNLDKATTSVRGVGRSMKEARDVEYAKQSAEVLQSKLADLEQEFKDELDKLTERLDASTLALTQTTIKPKRTNVQARAVALVWLPCWRSADGTMKEAWGA